MKKWILILVLVAMAIGLILPFITSSKKEESVRFTFKENLATEWNKAIPIEIAVNAEVKRIDVFYNDSLVNTFSNPKEKVKFTLNAGYFGLGTRILTLKAYGADGTVLEDERLLRVLSDVVPDRWNLSILRTFPHSKEHFTQGLEFDGNQLYESTGDPDRTGKTTVGILDLGSGSFSKKIGLDANYFGEGITILGDEIYQLTYTEGKCFVYDKATLQLKREFVYAGQGWGLTNDGTYLYMSDGSERITIRDPKTFEVVETLEVYDHRGPIKQLNELEFVDGIIYANVWQTNAIIAFQSENGKVVGIIDASVLEREGSLGGDVLNGIAYNKSSSTFYLTGKYWSKLFEVKFEQ